MDAHTLNHCFEFALQLVKDAGNVIRHVKLNEFQTKDTSWNLVTEYDGRIETTLIDALRKEFPSHKFIGEEGAAASDEEPVLTDDPTWVIDPIDGTTNFVHGFPQFAICVGFTVNKQELFGIIYNPVLEELYTAQKGKGAYCNGKQIFASKIEDVNKSLVNFEVSLARYEEFRDVFLARMKAFACNCQGVRSTGSAALGLCYVATGMTDAYQCSHIYPWDVVAANVIVREAGGYICDINGSELNIMKPNILATGTKKLADTLVELVRQAEAEIK